MRPRLAALALVAAAAAVHRPAQPAPPQPARLRRGLASGGANEPAEGNVTRVEDATVAKLKSEHLKVWGNVGGGLWWTLFAILAACFGGGALGLAKQDHELRSVLPSKAEPAASDPLLPKGPAAEAASTAPPLYTFWDPRPHLDSLFFRPARGGTFCALDGLRAFAFIWVLLFHVQMNGLGLEGDDAFAFFVGKGEAGVSVFLVLSGFLLAHVIWRLVDKDGRSALDAYGTFAWRRVARIYPALLAGVALTQVSIAVARGDRWDSACGTSSSFMGLPTSSGLGRVVSDAATGIWNRDPELFAFGCPMASSPWTVSLELQCYCLTPPLVILYHYRPELGWAAGLAATLGSQFIRLKLTCAYARLQLQEGAGLDHLGDLHGVYSNLPARLGEYLLGVLAYWRVCRADRAPARRGDAAAATRIEMGSTPRLPKPDRPSTRRCGSDVDGPSTKTSTRRYVLDEKRRRSRATGDEVEAGPKRRVLIVEACLVGALSLVGVCWVVWYRGYWAADADQAVVFESSNAVRGAVLYIWLHFFSVALATSLFIAAVCAFETTSTPTKFARDALAHPALYPFASLSYTAYLCQGIALNAADMQPWPGGGWARAAQVLAGALLAGLAVSLTVERPILKISTLWRSSSSEKPRPTAYGGGRGGAGLLVAAAAAFALLGASAPPAPFPIPGPLLAKPLMDHMVLQHDLARLWGATRPFARITVAMDKTGYAYRTRANILGEWELTLPYIAAAAESRTLTISTNAGDGAVLDDVLFGDVFLCSGQSNMVFPVIWTTTAAEDAKALAEGKHARPRPKVGTSPAAAAPRPRAAAAE